MRPLYRTGVSLPDICLTVHHWYKWYRQPTTCNNNGLLMILVSSTCFGQLFSPSSGALDCVLQLCCRPATSWVPYTTSCNTRSSAPEDGQNNCPKLVELIGIINKPLLLYLVGCQYYLYLIIFFWDLLNNLNLTPILKTWRIWWAPNNASRWQMGFNSAFKG